MKCLSRGSLHKNSLMKKNVTYFYLHVYTTTCMDTYYCTQGYLVQQHPPGYTPGFHQLSGYPPQPPYPPAPHPNPITVITQPVSCQHHSVQANCGNQDSALPNHNFCIYFHYYRTPNLLHQCILSNKGNHKLISIHEVGELYGALI